MPALPCGVEGCKRPRICKGWCRTHYMRVRRQGDPLADGRTVDGRSLVDGGACVLLNDGVK